MFKRIIDIYRTDWDKNLLIPLSAVIKLIYPTECGDEMRAVMKFLSHSK
jgi:hypothetical protein